MFNILEYSDNKFKSCSQLQDSLVGHVYSDPVAVINSEDWDEDGIPDNMT